MLRKVTLALALLVALTLVGGAAAATLTSRNSVSYALMHNSTETMSGTKPRSTDSSDPQTKMTP